MFEKKETIFRKKDRQTWKQIRRVLKDAGIRVSAGHFLQEALMPCGCGAKLDPRDFGEKGKVDREIYFIRVKESDLARAGDIIRQNGLETAILRGSIVNDKNTCRLL